MTVTEVRSPESEVRSRDEGGRRKSEGMTPVVIVRKMAIAAVGLLLLGTSGYSFYQSRHLREAVVLGPGVTAIKHLGDYFDDICGVFEDVKKDDPEFSFELR